jgi:hypothetical protein
MRSASWATGRGRAVRLTSATNCRVPRGEGASECPQRAAPQVVPIDAHLGGSAGALEPFDGMVDELLATAPVAVLGG